MRPSGSCGRSAVALIVELVEWPETIFRHVYVLLWHLREVVAGAGARPGLSLLPARPALALEPAQTGPPLCAGGSPSALERLSHGIGDHPSLNSPLIDQVIDAIERQTAHDQIREVIVVGQDRYGRVPPHSALHTYATTSECLGGAQHGAQLANGSYLLFIDADCIAAPDLIGRILECHRQGHPVVGGGVALEPGNYWTTCDNVLVFAPFLTITARGPRPYLPGLNISIAREIFVALDGFDQRFSNSAGEDI